MSTRRDVKTSFKHGAMSQDRRRQAALKRQKEARRDHLMHARSMLSGGSTSQQEEFEEEVPQSQPFTQQPQNQQHEQQQTSMWVLGSSTETTIPQPTQLEGSSKQKRASARANRVRERRRYWASQVSTPEWMTEIPNDLNGAGSMVGSGWYVRPRPEGRRCMVVANDGKTWSRQLDGNILHRWHCSLPFGSPETNRGHGRSSGGADNSSDFVLLDCVFDDTTSTYWILDAMNWKQTSLYDSTAEFRLYWLYQQLQEECPTVCEPQYSGPISTSTQFSDSTSPQHQQTLVGYPLKMCPYYDCTPEGLRMAYEGEQPFLRDGLLFYLKEGMYEPGSSPLVLQWKDTFSSRYLIYSTNQQAVLQVGSGVSSREEGNVIDSSQAAKGWNATAPHVTGSETSLRESTLTLQTLEGLQVGLVPSDFAAANQISEGDLLKFNIEGVDEVEGVSDDLTSYSLRNPVFLGKCSPSRALADSWSKLVFHFRARTTPEPTINQILECCHSVIK